MKNLVNAHKVFSTSNNKFRKRRTKIELSSSKKVMSESERKVAEWKKFINNWDGNIELLASELPSVKSLKENSYV